MEDEVRFDIKKLENFEKVLKKKYIAKVGILKNSAHSSGMGNAEIGAVHEFGSYTKKIPARSFLRGPLMSHGKEIVKEVAEQAMQAFVDGEPKKAYAVLGIAGENIVQKAFETSGFGKWAPNKPATIARKGSAQPLVDTSQLRRSITSEVGTK